MLMQNYSGFIYIVSDTPVFTAFALWAPSPNIHSSSSTCICGLLAYVVFDSTLREIVQTCAGNYRSSYAEVRKGVHILFSLVT